MPRELKAHQKVLEAVKNTVHAKSTFLVSYSLSFLIQFYCLKYLRFIIFLDVVKLVDWYIYEKHFIIVMEYLEGYEDICDYIDKHGFVSEESAKKLFKKVC